MTTRNRLAGGACPLRHTDPRAFADDDAPGVPPGGRSRRSAPGRRPSDVPAVVRPCATPLRWYGVQPPPGEATAVDRGAVLELWSGPVRSRAARVRRAQAGEGYHLVVVVGAVAHVDQRHSRG